jgi:carbon monoxide dehydrogenase subunit G
MNTLIKTQRIIPFSPECVYDAFANAKTFASWWGPNGFTNEFEIFEFKIGGHWKFTMIAPNGGRFANQSVFVDLKPAERLVIRHDCAPFFTLIIKLEPHASGTMLHWEGNFDDPKVLESIKGMAVPATEQNIDRLIQALKNEAAA